MEIGIKGSKEVVNMGILEKILGKEKKQKPKRSLKRLVMMQIERK